MGHSGRSAVRATRWVSALIGSRQPGLEGNWHALGFLLPWLRSTVTGAARGGAHLLPLSRLRGTLPHPRASRTAPAAVPPDPVPAPAGAGRGHQSRPRVTGGLARLEVLAASSGTPPPAPRVQARLRADEGLAREAA